MIDIALFGPTTVWVEDQRIGGEDLGGVKPRQVLEMLAVAPGTPLSKEVIAERLWEGHPPSSYVATLESYVCVLRRRLGLAGGRCSALATLNKGYVLDPTHVSVDLDIVRRVLSRGGPAEVATMLETVGEGLLASDPFAGWADAQRDMFGAELAEACLRQAQLADAAHRRSLAVQLARTAVAHNGYSEDARQVLMRTLWHAGERTEAVLTYVEFRERVHEELGVEPGSVTQRLYVTILRDEFIRARDTDRMELGLLVRLLKQALEGAGPSAGSQHTGIMELGRLMAWLEDAPSDPRRIRTPSTSVPRPRTDATMARSAYR